MVTPWEFLQASKGRTYCWTKGPCGPEAPEPPDPDGGPVWTYAGSSVRDRPDGTSFLVTRWTRPEGQPGKIVIPEDTQDQRRERALALLGKK